MEEVLASPMVSDPLHLLEICAVSDGAAAVVLGSEEQARRLGGAAGAGRRLGRRDRAVRRPRGAHPDRVAERRTRPSSTPARSAARCARRWRRPASGPATSTCSRWPTTPRGTCWPGPSCSASSSPASPTGCSSTGSWPSSGRLPINPSGGFLSFGEATTAQGVLQVCELAWQLRGQADGRQVPGARVGRVGGAGAGRERRLGGAHDLTAARRRRDQEPNRRWRAAYARSARRKSTRRKSGQNASQK